MIDYKENLKLLLSYYPHIYLSVDDQVRHSITNYVIRSKWSSRNGVINVFECHAHRLFSSYIQIDISLDELSNMIDQIKRDEKLKEVMEIVNENN